MANPGADQLGYAVPERFLSPPTSISSDAQAILASRPPAAPPGFPQPTDHRAWQDFISAADRELVQLLEPRLAPIPGRLTEYDIDGVRVIDVLPPAVDPDDCLYIDIHGGALITGGGDACRLMAKMIAARVGTRLWSIDYRMPPAHPYPAGLSDCLTVYRAALASRRPDRLIVGGISAGANLAAALILRARDEGLPLPAAAALISPELDLTESGDSFATLAGVDVVLTRRLMPANVLYAGGHDLSHPYLSPLFGDFTDGFPPTFLTAGTRDMFLSNAVRMHRSLRRAGVPTELHVFEAMPHGGFTGMTAEDAELWSELRQFLADRWA